MALVYDASAATEISTPMMRYRTSTGRDVWMVCGSSVEPKLPAKPKPDYVTRAKLATSRKRWIRGLAQQ